MAATSQDEKPMHHLSAELDTFVSGVERYVAAHAAPGDALAITAATIFRNLDEAAPESDRPEPAWLPVCRHLDTALEALRTQAELARIARSVAAIAPALHWRRKSDAEGAEPGFAEGHANAVVIGPGGLRPSRTVQIGVSLVAPTVVYPDHRHPPAEVYLVLSPGDWRRRQGDWFTPGVGGLLYNEPGVVHAMRAVDRPLFAVWCLWLGDEALRV